MRYVAKNPDDAAGTSFNIIYWTLFIFYAFHAVDELIELYAVYFKREKGALGLLLELNYFLGAFIMVWILIFVNSEEALAFSTSAENAHIYDWLHYQEIVCYVILGLSVVMGICFWCMQGDVVRQKEVANSEGEKGQQVGTAIN